jgi:transcriptional regulator with XRE-family HTH domain
MAILNTPLREWLKANNRSVGSLARELNVSRPRAQFWVKGATMPRGALLYSLMTLTGLQVPDLVPNQDIQDSRRERAEQQRLEDEKRREEAAAKRRRRLLQKRKGKAKATLTRKRGAGARTPRNKRKRARR